MFLRACSIEKEHWSKLGQEFENLIKKFELIFLWATFETDIAN